MKILSQLFGIHPSICKIVADYLFRFTNPNIISEIDDHIEKRIHSESIMLYCLEYNFTTPDMTEFIESNNTIIIRKIANIFTEDMTSLFTNVARFSKISVMAKEYVYAGTNQNINTFDEIILEGCVEKNKSFLDLFIHTFNLAIDTKFPFQWRIRLMHRFDEHDNSSNIAIRSIFIILAHFADIEGLDFMWKYFKLQDHETVAMPVIVALLYHNNDVMKNAGILNFIKTKICNPNSGYWLASLERIRELECELEQPK